MSWSRSYPNTFTGQVTNQVTKNHEEEFKAVYNLFNNLFSGTGHAHTGNGSDGAPIATTGIADGAITTAKLASDAKAPFAGTADTATSISATNVVNTPAGNIAATTIQAAINELDTEKAKLGGDASQVFLIAAATLSTQAVRLGQISIVGSSSSWCLTIPVWNGSSKIDFRIQGGYQLNVLSSNSTPQSFYTPFSNTCVGVWLTASMIPGDGQTNASHGVMPGTYNITTSSFTIDYTAAAETRSFRWVAVGW